MFLNLIILKPATKYQNSSTMANGIGWAHKSGKQNIKWPGRTIDPSTATSTNSNSNDNLNENTDNTGNE